MKITIIRYSQRDGRKKKIDHTSRRRKQIFLFSLIDWEYKTQVGKKKYSQVLWNVLLLEIMRNLPLFLPALWQSKHPNKQEIKNYYLN